MKLIQRIFITNLFVINLALAFLFVTSSSALAKKFNIKPDTSTLGFVATQSGSAVKGEFKNISGQIDFDPKDLEHSSVKVTIDMKTVNSADKDALSALPGKEYFDVASFTNASFSSTKFKNIKDNEYEVLGNLTIKGQTKPITLNFILDSYSKESTSAHGTANIKRKDFNVGEASEDSILNKVMVNFKIDAVSAN